MERGYGRIYIGFLLHIYMLLLIQRDGTPSANDETWN